MNSDQEAEFHLAVYHYFLWKACHEKSKERSVETEKDPQHHVDRGGIVPNDLERRLPANNSTPVNNSLTSVDSATAGDTIVNATGSRPLCDGSTIIVDTPLDVNKENLTGGSQRYQLTASMMLQQFPEHLSFFSSQHLVQMGLSVPPPIVRNLFIDLPRLQNVLTLTRNRIAQLEHVLKQVQSENIHMRTLLGHPVKRKRQDHLGKPCETSSKQPRLSMDTFSSSNRSGNSSLVTLGDASGAKKGTTMAIVNATNTQHESAAKGTGSVTEPSSDRTDLNSDVTQETTKLVQPKTNFTFEERMEQLQHFRKGNGHCRVPYSQPGLGRWAADVRALYRARQNNDGKCTVLTDARVSQLEGMGFEWCLKTTIPWEHRFQDLVKYKEQHGHCNVPRNDPKLGEFVHWQRMMHLKKSKSMFEPTEPGTKSRADQLNEIGFVWYDGTGTKATFEDRLEECREFRRKHDHLSIPLPPKKENETSEEETPEKRKERLFLLWAQRQRYQYRRHKQGMKTYLDKNQIRKLNELGFDWDVGGASSDAALKRGKGKDDVAFKEYITILAQIKEKYGDCCDYKNLLAAGYSQSSKLYQWMKRQRKAWKAFLANQYTTLNAERIRLLNDIDFNFEPYKHRAPFGSLKAKDQSRGNDARTDATPGDDVGTRNLNGDDHGHVDNMESSDESDEDEKEVEDNVSPRRYVHYHHSNS